MRLALDTAALHRFPQPGILRERAGRVNRGELNRHHDLVGILDGAIQPMALSAVLAAPGLILVEYGLSRVEVAHLVLHHQDGHRRPPAVCGSSDRTRAAPLDNASPAAGYRLPSISGRGGRRRRVGSSIPRRSRGHLLEPPSALTACHQAAFTRPLRWTIPLPHPAQMLHRIGPTVVVDRMAAIPAALGRTQRESRHRDCRLHGLTLTPSSGASHRPSVQVTTPARTRSTTSTRLSSRRGACFALAEQASEEAGPARLVLLPSGRGRRGCKTLAPGRSCVCPNRLESEMTAAWGRRAAAADRGRARAPASSRPRGC